MPFLNLNYGLVIFEDRTDRNPQIKLPDITKAVQGVVVTNDKSERFQLGPGESQTILVTSRTIGLDSTTQLTVDRYLAAGDNVRLRWTGTGSNPAFRTNRAIGGDATTVVTATRVTPYVVRFAQVAGTAWSLGSVQSGDTLKIEKTTDAFTSPFSGTNQGKTFTVQAKGSNYVDVIDNGLAALDTAILLGASFEFAIRVFSAGSVKVGDTVTLSGTGINPSNQGKFEIVDLSYDYVEIVNPFGEPGTFLIGTNVFTIYDYLIGFLHLRASGPIQIKYDAQVEWASLDRIGPEVILLASPSAYQVIAYNPSSSQEVVISVQHAQVVGSC
jgi:hypothetical protein